MPKKSTPKHIIFNLQKIKRYRKNLEKCQRGKKYLIYRAKIKITANISENMQSEKVK